MSLAHDLAARALTGLDPETAHRMTIRALARGLGPRSFRRPDPILVTDLAGLKLASPVGLAPGFDKNAEVPDAMLRAGFGFVECGTVTPRPQAGNPRPRLFRLWEDRAVINRMGFNNEGLDAFAARLARRKRRGVVGANIGANKDSDDRIADYVIGLKRLWGLCDYLTINISSPNTPGLRDLQSAAALEDLLGAVGEARRPLAGATPLFLKVAPDIADEEVESITSAALRHGLAGLIISNTTIARAPTLQSPLAGESGGLSGRPLMTRSTELLRLFRRAAGDRLVLIGVGGIAGGADALAKIKAGAAAVQLYSAMVFEGPGLVNRITRDLAAALRAEGFASVADAVGVEA